MQKGNHYNLFLVKKWHWMLNVTRPSGKILHAFEKISYPYTLKGILKILTVV